MPADPDNRPVVRIGHSPDPDDAFMWFPITGIDGAAPLVATGRFRFEAAAEDIESLNRRSERADLEITAISIAQYPHVADRYALTSCGGSMGFGYGPKIVARERMSIERLATDEVVLAVPGERTSAFLATGLLLGRLPARYEAIDFAEILPRVESGEFDAGVVIHEGQLTFERHGLVELVDLGAWWSDRTDLPLPLGGNAIRRDLEAQYGPGTLAEITTTLLCSIRYAMEHREQAVAYALRFGRDLDHDLADRFVSMYVNEQTLDFGEAGRAGIRRFLREAGQAGLAPAIESIDFVGPG